MILKDAICIEDNISVSTFRTLLNTILKEFEQYSFEYKEPYTFFESVPNTNYNPDAIPPDEEYLYEYRTADCGFDAQLKNINHINFNIKCFLYQGKIYIAPCAYYYATFNADKLKNLIIYLLEQKTFTTDSQLLYNKKTYKEWTDQHSDQKWSQHNYKIDKEDLAKIGIEV